MPGRCLRASLLLLAAACGPMAGRSPESRHVPAGPVPCVFIERDGDPETALAASIVTLGIDDDARPAVALAALLRARLSGKWPGVTLVPGGDGLRIQGLVAETDVRANAAALRAALTTPVTGAELEAPKNALAALAHRPLPLAAGTGADATSAVTEVARCEGTPYFRGNRAELTRDELEAWRSAAIGEGRLAFGVVGKANLEDDASRILIGGARWPRAASFPASATLSDGIALVEASPLVPPATARARIAFRDPSPAAVASVAADLADAQGSLASRLAALGTPRSPVGLREVTATAHPFGGCLEIEVDVAGARFAEDPSGAAGRVADAVALARQEVALRLMKPAPPSTSPARRAGDPREAAALASWWALVHDDLPEKKAVSVMIETAAPPRTDAPSAPVDALRAAIDRATHALGSPIAEARVKVERGQEELWVLMASPCGTSSERSSDAGLGAAFVVAAASAGSSRGEADVALEPWISVDGLGLVAHGPSRAGEDPDSHARRIADAAARALAAEPIDGATLSLVRGSLLAKAQSAESRTDASVALGLYPDHPSWLDARGTAESIARSSDGAMLARGDDLRSGPFRVAVLANESSPQGAEAVKAADRWIARRSIGVRACEASSTAAAARPGTYAIDAAGKPPRADLALRLPHDDSAARNLASWWASLLDGRDGLLASAVGAPGLARSWSARVIGPDRDASLAVSIVSSDAALDSAVAQTRALLDRLRQGALTQADITRAQARRSREGTLSALDPRARLVALWRGTPAPSAPPTLDALKTFAAATFRDDALVVVAARPPRFEEPPHEKTP